MRIIDGRVTSGRAEMFNDAFKILGIEPTTDRRAIRVAYVRLARIYHPDRFVGQPSDVRAEAERRMKEATTAYESLRSARKTAATTASKATGHGKKDPWEESRRVREAAAARKLEAQQNRTRWLLWEELERQARERAAFEAQQAAWIADDGTAMRLPEPEESVDPVPSNLAKRLAEARSGNGDALARRSQR